MNIIVDVFILGNAFNFQLFFQFALLYYSSGLINVISVFVIRFVFLIMKDFTFVRGEGKKNKSDKREVN